MANRIYLESKDVFGFWAHLFLVLRPEVTDPNDITQFAEGEVIRGLSGSQFVGGSGTSDLETFVGPLSASGDRYDVDVNAQLPNMGLPGHESRTTRASLDITDIIGGVDGWAKMADTVRELNNVYDYDVAFFGT